MMGVLIMKRKNVILSISLDYDTYIYLKTVSGHRKTSVSAFIRYLINKYAEQEMLSHSTASSTVNNLPISRDKETPVNNKINNEVLPQDVEWLRYMYSKLNTKKLLALREHATPGRRKLIDEVLASKSTTQNPHNSNEALPPESSNGSTTPRDYKRDIYETLSKYDDDQLIYIYNNNHGMIKEIAKKILDERGVSP